MRTKKPTPLKFSPRIKGNDYVRIPGSNLVISREEHYNGLTHENALYSLNEDKRIMPPTRLFMPYFANVIRANNGKIILYDANNKPITRDEVEELYEKLTSNCWTRLNNTYREVDNDLFDETVLSISRKGKNSILTLERYSLEQYIMEDCFVDLEFNKQGLPIRRSSNQEYIQGKNIYFDYPRKNSVARFNAGSSRTYLYCNGDPAYSDAGLGVFDCAEGAPKN